LKLKNAEFASVISDFTKSIELNPYNFYAYNNRGNAYFDRKDFRSAIEDYSQAIQIKVDYTYSYLRRGTASYEFVLYGDKLAQKKLEEEGADEESKKDKFTKDPAECKAQWEQEFKEMEEAERKEKERVQLLNNAIADFKTILTFDPNDIEAYNHRCKVYEMLGDEENVKLDKNKILELEVQLAKDLRR
jgi:tetratricopeptide (TPR) repeat protein